ncbi:50S ribosomal protein L39e [Candidatus Woesearchaeota archaeon]|nr:50S ribosomal protein L39e [Candidatus Woesearchaeota archaeon]
MGSIKTSGKKKRLNKAAKQTRWAPFWLIPKIFGPGRRIHPARITRKKRNWRRFPRIKA